MFWLLFSVVLGALGQLFLKIASVQANRNELLYNFYQSLFSNYNAWIGAFCYGLSFIVWFRVLAKFDLSYARPFVGLGYAVTAVLSIVFLNEKVTLLRWGGIALITAGSILLGFSKDV